MPTSESITDHGKATEWTCARQCDDGMDMCYCEDGAEWTCAVPCDDDGMDVCCTV